MPDAAARGEHPFGGQHRCTVCARLKYFVSWHRQFQTSMPHAGSPPPPIRYLDDFFENREENDSSDAESAIGSDTFASRSRQIGLLFGSASPAASELSAPASGAFLVQTKTKGRALRTKPKHPRSLQLVSRQQRDPIAAAENIQAMQLMMRVNLCSALFARNSSKMLFKRRAAVR